MTEAGDALNYSVLFPANFKSYKKEMNFKVGS